MEAEYIVLSTSAREILPLHSILADIIKYGHIEHNCNVINLQGSISLTTTSLQSKQNGKWPSSIVYEDNAGCIILAMEHNQNHPQTKLIGINYHHFQGLA